MTPLQQFLIVGGFLTGSYTTFHGHRLNKDCQWCQYRGIGWISAVSLVLWADYWEKKAKEANLPHRWDDDDYQPMRNFPPRSPTYSNRENEWENNSDSGSDDSNDTERGPTPQPK